MRKSIVLSVNFRCRAVVKKYILLIVLLLSGYCTQAQFVASTPAPGARPLGKNFFGGLTGRDSLGVSRMWFYSLALPGYSQLYNRDYWKLPILYGGVGGLAYAGYHNNMNFLDTGNEQFKTNRNLCYIGAGLVYWAALLDGLASYNVARLGTV